MPGPYSGFHNLTSAYPTPIYNALITPKGATDSRHMFGDAADHQDNSGTRAELDFLNMMSMMAGSDAQESAKLIATRQQAIVAMHTRTGGIIQACILHKVVKKGT